MLESVQIRKYKMYPEKKLWVPYAHISSNLSTTLSINGMKKKIAKIKMQSGLGIKIPKHKLKRLNRASTIILFIHIMKP